MIFQIVLLSIFSSTKSLVYSVPPINIRLMLGLCIVLPAGQRPRRYGPLLFKVRYRHHSFVENCEYHQLFIMTVIINNVTGVGETKKHPHQDLAAVQNDIYITCCNRVGTEDCLFALKTTPGFA